MLIQSLPPTAYTSPARASAPAAPPPDAFVRNQPEPYEFVFPTSVPKTDEAQFKLPEENPPRLARPVLFVHGYNGAAGNWQHFVDWFTRDDINRFGGSVKGDGQSQLDPQGKVFTMTYTRPFNSCGTNARELRAAVEHICRVTGAAEVDIVAHSKGGVDSRLYVDQGDEKCKHLVMIGTPNHGTILADLELQFRDLGLPMFPPVDDAEVRQALNDLRVERNNPLVTGLNQRLPQQKERAEMLTVDANGVPTLADKTLLTFKGDGVITRSSVQLEGVPSRRKWWVNHTSVKNHPDVLRATAAFLTDQPLPAEEQDPPDLPPDQEFVPERIVADSEKLEYLITGTTNRAS